MGFAKFSAHYVLQNKIGLPCYYLFLNVIRNEELFDLYLDAELNKLKQELSSFVFAMN